MLSVALFLALAFVVSIVDLTARRKVGSRASATDSPVP
jgi:hypothetical protein